MVVARRPLIGCLSIVHIQEQYLQAAARAETHAVNKFAFHSLGSGQ